MTNRILLLVHVEETFRCLFNGQILRNIVRAVKSGNYRRVIHATSNIDDWEPISELAPYVDETIDWGWGYEPAMFTDRIERKWVIPADNSLHEYTWVPPQLRGWSRGPVTLGGGCDGECLADMEACLKYVGISYRRARSLIYGS